MRRGQCRRGAGSSQSGSALLDVLLAMALVALAVGSMVGGTLAAIKATYRARDLHAASLAAREQIEELRARPRTELAALAGSAPVSGGLTQGGFTPAVETIVYKVYDCQQAGSGCFTQAGGLFKVRVALRRGGQEFFSQTAYLRPGQP